VPREDMRKKERKMSVAKIEDGIFIIKIGEHWIADTDIGNAWVSITFPVT
jgi:hypothetical protein